MFLFIKLLKKIIFLKKDLCIFLWFLVEYNITSPAVFNLYVSDLYLTVFLDKT